MDLKGIAFRENIGRPSLVYNLVIIYYYYFQTITSLSTK